MGYAASRAHHADVGGMTPGSMPAGSRELFQEGLVLPPVRLVAAGVLREDVVAIILANSRTPGERAGDLRAQIAAHRLADARMEDLGPLGPGAGPRRVWRAARLCGAPDARGDCAHAGWHLPCRGFARGRRCHRRDSPHPGRGHGGRGATDRRLLRYGRGRPRELQLSPGGYPLGGVLRGALGHRSGHSRLLSGAFTPVQVIAPPGCLVNAHPPAAVAAGNVETSSRIVDVVHGRPRPGRPGPWPWARAR